MREYTTKSLLVVDCHNSPFEERYDFMKNIGKQLWKIIETIAHAVLAFCFRLIHKELTDDAFAAFMQFVKFGMVGVSNTIISYVLYAASLIIFKRLAILPRTNYLAAQVISFVLSVAWSFYWNNKLVFVVEEGKERSVWKTLLKTYVSYSFTGLFLNTILLVVWVDCLHFSEFLAPIINLLVNVPINFLINKFWAFRVKDEY